MLCTQIMAHPMNMCGGEISSVRARSLATSIIYDGHDPIEASVNNLLVEAVVDENGQVDRKFTEHYLATAGKDEHNLSTPAQWLSTVLCARTRARLLIAISWGEIWSVHVFPPRWRGSAHAMLSQSWFTEVAEDSQCS